MRPPWFLLTSSSLYKYINEKRAQTIFLEWRRRHWWESDAVKSPRYEFYDGGRRKAFIICGLRSDPRYPRYQAEPRQEEATANNGRGERSWMEKTEREREKF